MFFEVEACRIGRQSTSDVSTLMPRALLSLRHSAVQVFQVLESGHQRIALVCWYLKIIPRVGLLL